MTSVQITWPSNLAVQVTPFAHLDHRYSINYNLQLLTSYPSCLHTTLASLLSQPLSHTVPHTPLMQISTLPALSSGPSTKRSVSLVQFWAAMEIKDVVTSLKHTLRYSSNLEFGVVYIYNLQLHVFREDIPHMLFECQQTELFTHVCSWNNNYCILHRLKICGVHVCYLQYWLVNMNTFGVHRCLVSTLSKLLTVSGLYQCWIKYN